MHIPPAFFFLIVACLLKISAKPVQATSYLPDNKDSTETVRLIRKSGELVHTNPDSARKLAESASALAKTSRHFELYSSALNIIGVTFYVQGELERAMQMYQKSLETLISGGYPEHEQFNVLQNMGRIFLSKGNYEQGIPLLKRSLEIARRAKDPEEISLALLGLGQAYFELNKQEATLSYFYQALYYAKKTNDKLRISQLYNDLGNVYYAQNNFSLALKLYKESKVLKEAINDETGLPTIVMNIGCVYEALGDNPTVDRQADGIQSAYTLAGNYYDSALVMARELNLRNTESLVLNNIGTVLIKTGDSEGGVLKCKAALEIAEKTGTLIYQRDACSCLSKGYKKLKNYEQALHYTERYTALKDSIFNEENERKLTQLQSEQNQKLQDYKQQAAVDHQKQLNQIELNQERNKIRILLSLLGLTILIIGVFYWQRMKIQHNYEELVHKNMELMASEAEILRIKQEIISSPVLEEPKTPTSAKAKKESKSALSQEQTKFLSHEIDLLLVQQKLYLNHDLTLQQLTERLNSNSNYVSRVINELYDKNFSSLINELRVKEARRLLSDAQNNHLTIEAIAHKVGFNSIPSFNIAFKKFTGVSPSFFKTSSQQR
jgi:AraC-like DNA-binding protein